MRTEQSAVGCSVPLRDLSPTPAFRISSFVPVTHSSNSFYSLDLTSSSLSSPSPGLSSSPMSPLQVNQNPYRWDWICCEADHGSSSSTTITSSSYVSLSDDMSDFPIDRDIEMGAPSTSSSTSGSAAWKAAFPPIIRNASELTAVDVPIDVIPCEDEACSAPVLCCEDEECQAIEKEGGGKVRQMTMLDPNLNPAALARRAHEQSCSQCHPIASHADMTPPACCDPTCLSQQEEGRGIVAMTGAKQMTAQETSGNIGDQTELGMYQCTDEECKILAAYVSR